MTYLTRDLVESLDVIFVRPFESQPYKKLLNSSGRIKGIKIEPDGKLYTGKELKKFLIFGVYDIESYGNNTGFDPVVPLMSLGKPELSEYHNKEEDYYSNLLFPFELTEEGILRCVLPYKKAKNSDNAFMSAGQTVSGKVINVNRKTGKASEYIGLNEFIYPTIFDKPIKFDPDKRLLYLRSPNGNFKIKNFFNEIVLHENLNLGIHQINEEKDGIKIYEQTTDNVDFLLDEQFGKRCLKRIYFEDIKGIIYMNLLEATININREIIPIHFNSTMYIVPNEEFDSIDLKNISSENCSFEEVLWAKRIDITENSTVENYHLAYVNLEHILNNHRWATKRIDYYTRNIEHEINQHLFLEN